MKNGCFIQNQRIKLLLGGGGTKKRKMTSDVSKGHLLLVTSERSQCQCKPWMSPRNTYPCPGHITNKYAEVPKFPTAYKRYETQISLDIPWPIRPRHGRSVRELFSENQKFASAPPVPER